MLRKSLKLFTNNNLFLRHKFMLKAYENKSLSTSATSANQYDELYKERFATFQCKLNKAFFFVSNFF